MRNQSQFENDFVLHKIEEIHRILLDESHDPIFAFSRDERYLFVNSAFAEGVGKPVEQIIGCTIWDVFEPEEAAFRVGSLRDVFQSGAEKVIEVRVPRPDKDKYYLTTITPIFDAHASVSMIICSSKDITERKQAEWFQAEAQRQQEMVFELLPDATFVIDLHGKVVFWNKAIAEMTGIPKEQMIGKGDYEYAIPFYGDRRPILIDKALRYGKDEEEFDFNYDFIVQEGDTFVGEIAVPQIFKGKGAYLLGSASILRNSAGKTIGAIETIRDISERKSLERNLEESEEKYRLLVTKMKQGLAVHEVIQDENGRVLDYRFLDINASFEEMSGLKREDVLGKSILEINPQMKTKWIEKYGQVALTGEALQYEMYHAETGRHYEMVIYSPKQVQFAIMATDITDRKRMEKIIHEEKERFKTTLLSVGDGVIATDETGKVVLINPIAERLTGWTKIEAVNKPLEEIFHIIHEYSRERCANPVQRVLETSEIVELDNHTVLVSKEGMERPIEDTAAPIQDEDQSIQGAVLVFRDCTEKLEKQREIAYLSYHDQLTGLYNRRYFAEALVRLDQEKNLPITLVMADLNGLKLTNDAFGHLLGDELLQRAADIMKKELRANDLIARIGGDEFIMLLPRTDAEQAAVMVNRINHNLAKGKFDLDSLMLSISFGWATKYRMREDMTGIFKKAEDNMYRRKLSESSSMRNRTIKVITKTLYEKNEREQQHSARVSQLCEMIGVALDLSLEDINELRTVGLMHDIGKITIDDYILEKKEALNEAEWLEIKRHVETGYRILSSINEYAQLAEYVLAHHERWDGGGYPKGLRGNSIPIAARIIAIADSYDAMTSNRPYRKAMSKDAAINEIIKNSGTQFDPELVKTFMHVFPQI